MKVELHINGRYVVQLIPETEIERMVLSTMLAGARNGKTLEAVETSDPKNSLLVSIEK